jgi:tetratricopeptide (TPR) repeat protein
MRIAVALAPDHRVVLRTAARLLVHFGRADEAHAILSAHPRTRNDPWLMATEISVAMILERIPQSPRAGRLLIGESAMPPGHLSELASALATLDTHNGDTKRARKLYTLSLEQPNDNVLAQAHWLAERDSSLRARLAKVPSQLPGCMEAECFRAQAENRWNEALQHAYEWHYDEPYSSRPANTACFIAATALQDYAAAIEIARAGLKVDPKDDLLTNNLIYALARNGEIDEAATLFDTLAASPHSRVSEFVFVATQGLLAFARGNETRGRADYNRAFGLAPNVVSKVRVLANWGQTEALYHHTKLAELIHETLQRAKHLPLDASTRCAVGAFGRIYQAARVARLAPAGDAHVITPVPALYVPNLFPQQLK